MHNIERIVAPLLYHCHQRHHRCRSRPNEDDFFAETKVASAYGRSRGLLCRVEEGGGEEEKARGDFYK